jgi:hypothetical protein
MKKVDYTRLSDKKCSVCGKPIKENVANRVQNAHLCYVCFNLSKGKTKMEENKLVNGEKVLVKIIDFKQIQRLQIQHH